MPPFVRVRDTPPFHPRPTRSAVSVLGFSLDSQGVGVRIGGGVRVREGVRIGLGVGVGDGRGVGGVGARWEYGGRG